MKKISLILLAGVVVLTAVEWDTEQITDLMDADSYEPILVLDEAGKARILYSEWGVDNYLRLASNATGTWQIEQVAQAQEPWVYGLDVDADGYSYVAYFDFVEPMGSDLFFATNKDGPFSPENITDDALFQSVPVVKLDGGGEPHLAFVQGISPEDDLQIWHGWFTPEGFQSEQVTDNMNQEDWYGHDLVFGAMSQAHIFYVGADNYLWHAFPGEVVSWDFENINELPSEWPSAVADPLGSYHVAYDVGETSIHYITNMAGTWQDEIVSDNIPPDGGIWRPSLALDKIYGYHAIGNPHVAWIRYDSDWWGDLWFASKSQDTWAEEAITSEPGTDEWPGYGHYFAVDNEGYGHIVYDFPDGNEVWQIFYAKSTEPIAEPVAVAEHQVPDVIKVWVSGSTVHFSLSRTSPVSVDLFDASGRFIEKLASGIFASGEHSVTVDNPGLACGVYFVHARMADQRLSAKLVVTR